MSISRESNISLPDAVKQGQAERVEYLLKEGLNANKTVKVEFGDALSYLSIAANNSDYLVAALLVKFGGDVFDAICLNYKHYINKCERLSEKDKILLTEKYRSSTLLLLDFAVGVNFESYSKYCGMSNFEFLRGIDISGLNFIGISFDGHPVTQEMLVNLKLKGAEKAKAITTLDDLEKLEDLNRQSIIKKNLSAAFEKRGEVVDEKTRIVNLIPIGDSIIQNDESTVLLRLAKGASPNSMHHDISLIGLAAAFGRMDTVIYLVCHPDFDKTKIPYAIQLAKLNKQESIALYLELSQDFNHQNSEGNTLLHIAAERGDIETIKKCIANKADLNIQNNQRETALHIVAGKNRNELYSYPLSKNNIEIIRLLLEAKADANIGKCTTALNLAARSRSDEAIKMLLPVTTKKDHIYEDYTEYNMVYKKEPWYVPLMFNSFGSKKWLETLTLLKENGADLNQQDNEHGYSLLMEVMFVINPQKVKNTDNFSQYLQQINFLLDNGVKLDTKNKYGQTALDILCDHFKSHMQSRELQIIIDLFVKRGLKLNDKTVPSYLLKQSFLKAPLSAGSYDKVEENKNIYKK